MESQLIERVIMPTLKSLIHLSRRRGLGWQVLVCAALVGMMQTASSAAPDGPPRLNVSQSCEAAARGAIAAGRNKEACMADERTAQDQIKKDWSTFARGDKTDCVGMNRTGGSPSYVELQTCLEIMRDAKKIRKEELLADPLLSKTKRLRDSQ